MPRLIYFKFFFSESYLRKSVKVIMTVISNIAKYDMYVH